MRPCSLTALGRHRLSSLSPERGDGAPSGASFSIRTLHPPSPLRASADKARASFGEGRAPFGAPSRRLYSAGPRFLTGELPPAVSELLAGDRSVPGRSPGAARAP